MAEVTEKAIIEEVVRIIRGYLPESYRIVLFGSCAQGGASAGSDLDIGIIGREEVPWTTLLSIRRAVETIATLRSIDVVDLLSVSESLKESALESAKDLG
jgi:predicted nucleotidyltransferase